jgi:uncharacterized sulfatase
MTAKKPNILFIFSDQQRWDTMGCYGQELPVTPSLDRLAAEGVRFELSFTCQPVCGPARACIQTGRYATENRCHVNGIRLPDGELFLADHLHEAGFETAYVGKWHLASNGPSDTQKRPVEKYAASPIPPHRRGGYRDYWLAADVLEHSSDSQGGRMWDGDMREHNYQGYRVDWTTDGAIDFLKRRKGDRPFFLFLSYLEPHHQNHRHRYEGPEGSWDKWSQYKTPGDLQGTGGDWRQNFPDYLGCCNSIDANFARIRAELERQGILEDTLVIYTSDHGSHFRTRNSEYKRSCHEGCVRTPLLLRGPGFTGGKVVKELASLIDTTPTVLRAADAPIPEQMRGHALQDAVAGRIEDWPLEVFIQISEGQIGRAIRTKKWKYSVRAPEDRKGMNSDLYIEDFIYDLEEDPHERNNLVRDPSLAEARAELAKILKRRMIEAGEKAPEIRAAV